MFPFCINRYYIPKPGIIIGKIENNNVDIIAIKPDINILFAILAFVMFNTLDNWYNLIAIINI